MAGADLLDELTGMNAIQLTCEWQALFGNAAPALPLSLLRRAIAYERQLGSGRGLPVAAERMLDALAMDPSTKVADPPMRLKVGTRLLREWNGRVHAVLITDDGALYEDTLYRSLSHVARTITGAHWSGPRFFGLARCSPPPSQRKAAHG